MNYNVEELIALINGDLENNVFSNWPVLKNKLKHIIKKLNKLKYLSNAEPLTVKELSCLKQNDYI